MAVLYYCTSAPPAAGSDRTRRINGVTWRRLGERRQMDIPQAAGGTGARSVQPSQAVCGPLHPATFLLGLRRAAPQERRRTGPDSAAVRRAPPLRPTL